MDDAVNYGAIGAVIGHEITHGFDDQGRQFDAEGNLRELVERGGPRAASRRARRRLVEQFDGYVAIDGLHVNGELTLGENIADLGGLMVAYDAFQTTSAGHGKAAAIDGFTPDQRFFLAYAQSWRRNYRAGGAQAAGQHRSALAGELPRQRAALEHASLRARVRLQGRRRDGQSGRDARRDLVTPASQVASRPAPPAAT